MTKDKILWTAQYAEGDLNEAESLEFENNLKHDEELKRYLLHYHDIHSSLQMELAAQSGNNDLLTTLHQLNKTYFTTAQPKVVKLSTYVKWLSSAAAILVVGLLIWAPWNADLYQQFNTAPQMTTAERGNAEKTSLDIASEYFNAGKYVQAKPIFSELHTQDNRNAMVSYFYAITLLETHEVAKGRLLLEELFRGTSIYKYDAAYTMAMSYLKEDKKTDTKFWLEGIPENAAQYAKAQALLKKL